jgi:hypothetical protein
MDAHGSLHDQFKLTRFAFLSRRSNRQSALSIQPKKSAAEGGCAPENQESRNLDS